MPPPPEPDFFSGGGVDVNTSSGTVRDVCVCVHVCECARVCVCVCACVCVECVYVSVCPWDVMRDALTRFFSRFTHCEDGGGDE